MMRTAAGIYTGATPAKAGAAAIQNGAKTISKSMKRYALMSANQSLKSDTRIATRITINARRLTIPLIIDCPILATASGSPHSGPPPPRNGVLLAVFFIIWGGIKYSTSAGDKNKVDAARKMIIYSIVGIIIIAFSFFILRIIGQMLNSPFLKSFGGI